MQRVSIDEVIKIKGEECRVVSINGRHLTVELLSSADRQRTSIESILNSQNRHERRAAEKKERDGR
jgi:hypothetical protein